MNILFCSDPLDSKKVDLDWQHEYEMTKRYCMNVIIFNYDTYINDGLLKSIKIISKPFNIESLVYRGWMMPVELYKKLYTDLLSFNYRLINSPEEYEHCYYLPRSYALIESKTPLSVFHSEHGMPEDKKLLELLSVFGNKPLIVKDYVKSQKHYWNEACFIPNASDLSHVKSIVSNFIKMQGDNFQGGLVFREFIELEPIGSHPKSDMPLTKEYRIFILKNKPIAW